MRADGAIVVGPDSRDEPDLTQSAWRRFRPGARERRSGIAAGLTKEIIHAVVDHIHAACVASFRISQATRWWRTVQHRSCTRPQR